MSSVNINIRNFRKFRKMSQKELGQKLNKSTNVVSNWENGIHSPDLDTIEEICKILRVTPDELFGWKENREYQHYVQQLELYQRKIEDLKRQKESIDKEIHDLEIKRLEEYSMHNTED